MNIKRWLLVPVCALLLVACGNDDKENTGSVNDGENQTTSNAVDHSIKDKSEDVVNGVPKSEKSVATESTSTDDKSVGIEMSGGTVKEATNVPADEEKVILQAFDEYIKAFNAEDIDRYSETLSKKPQGFTLEEDLEQLKRIFEDYNTKRTVKDVRIIKYNENEAQVYANITVEMEQEDGNKFKQPAKQVTVFAKEDGKWLVTSLFAVGSKED
ncbi:nuclear transport factor 2 family protein [Viridibacillus sp. NPDC096237]|uniref:nuclear transport factor 2 family protein n=1 Tax=Viridibacillus sp. NPDC096237 TaxID=3390721 RepID=UPI003CFBE43F